MSIPLWLHIFTTSRQIRNTCWKESVIGTNTFKYNKSIKAMIIKYLNALLSTSILG